MPELPGDGNDVVARVAVSAGGILQIQIPPLALAATNNTFEFPHMSTQGSSMPNPGGANDSAAASASTSAYCQPSLSIHNQEVQSNYSRAKSEVARQIPDVKPTGFSALSVAKSLVAGGVAGGV